MPLSAGVRLGPYEILSPLGAGGMGEVYRARDSKLKRDVAVKVLPQSLAADSDALARFEREALAVAALSHPNILSIFDFGTHEGTAYAVMELLDGETLRARLASGPVPQRQAVDYALQIARGLSAAHQKGVVHRDLKPENLFVTRDGLVKILDFGLAKKVGTAVAGEETSAPTVSGHTEPGTVMGTVGYMSPEQVRGQFVDQRSDLFSFGSVLYEMLSGRMAFRRDTRADTMSAILTSEPEELLQTGGGGGAGLDRVVRHCLEKNPEQRFQSARDLAFALESASVSSGSGPAAAPPARKRVPALAALLVLAVVAIPAAVLVGRRSVRYEPPIFQQLTYRRGSLLRARYTPDGGSIIYSAAWEGAPAEIFTARLDGTESRPFGIKNADVLAVSSKGEVAILLKKQNLRVIGMGTLAVIPLSGGAPRELLEDVAAADWSPDGTQLAVVRKEKEEWRLEYPMGHALYSSKSGFGLFLRVSGSGDRVAFTEKGVDLKVIDSQGRVTRLVHVGASEYIGGLSWQPGDREILFGVVTVGTRKGSVGDIDVVDMSGHVRTLYRGVPLTLLDARPDGRLLIEQARDSTSLMFASARDTSERNLGWQTDCWLDDLSEDGETFLFQDSNDIYLRRTDGSPAVRLGSGQGGLLSPDVRWVLMMTDAPHEISMIPTGPGQGRKISVGDLTIRGYPRLLPDEKTVLFAAVGADGQMRLYVADVTGRSPRPITGAVTTPAWPVSPDGKEVAVVDGTGRAMICPLDGGPSRAIAGFDPADDMVAWSADGRFLYVDREGEVPLRVERFDLATGMKEPWKTLVPPDEAGVYWAGNLCVTRDGKFWAYQVNRHSFDELWQVTGLAMR
jgi:hypothetical protein